MEVLANARRRVTREALCETLIARPSQAEEDNTLPGPSSDAFVPEADRSNPGYAPKIQNRGQASTILDRVGVG
jgi:hypothetical protein